jgi:hypothetical protein
VLLVVLPRFLLNRRRVLFGRSQTLDLGGLDDLGPLGPVPIS